MSDIDKFLDQVDQGLAEQQKPTTLFEAIVNDDKGLQSSPTLEQSLRFGGLDPERMRDLRYRDQIESAEDPEAERARIESAQIISQFEDVDVDEVLGNYDSYVNKWVGDPTLPAVSVREAMANAWNSGWIDTNIGKLAWQQGQAWFQGNEEEAARLGELIEEMEAQRPPMVQAKGGWLGKGFQFAAGIAPMMLQSMGKGAEVGAQSATAGAIAGSIIPGVGTAIGFSGGLISGQMVGSMSEMAQIEGGLTWRELDQMVDENGEGLAPEVKYATMLAVGGINAALEAAPMDDILDNLGITRGANKVLRRTIKRGLARVMGSKAYGEAIQQVGSRIVGGTVENTIEELIQQTNSILWRELAVEVNNSNFGTDLDHATMEQLKQELQDTALQSALGMGVISFGSGMVGAPSRLIGAQRQTAQVNRVSSALADAGYDVDSAEGATIEERVAETQKKAAEDYTGRSLSPVMTEFSTREVEGGDEVQVVTGTNANTEGRSGMLEYTVDEDGVAHITSAEYSGRSVEAKEIYRALVEKVGEENIVWELEGGARAEAIKDAFSDPDMIIDITEDTKFTDLKVTDRETFKTNLAQAFPQFKSEEVDASVRLLEIRAAAMGRSANEFIQEFIHEDAFISGIDMRHQGANVRGARLLVEEGKAAFYIGKSANFETWTHEFGHVIRSTLSTDELVGIEEALGIDGWDNASEEKFVDYFLNYLEKGEAAPEVQGALSKIVTYLKELWEVAKKIVGEENITEEMRSAFDKVFQAKTERTTPTSMADGRLAQKTIVNARNGRVSREATSLGFGVRGYTGTADAISKFRSEQVRKGARLTKNGEDITVRKIHEKIAQDVLEFQNENITAPELRRRIMERYASVNQSYERNAMKMDTETRSAVEKKLEAMRKDLMELTEDVEALGISLPQMGALAVAEASGDFLDFASAPSEAQKAKLRGLQDWMDDNNPLHSIVTTVKLNSGELRGYRFFGAVFEAIESGTGADVYDALVLAVGSVEEATGILVDLGFAGGMATENGQILDRTIYIPEKMHIVGNWVSLDKRTPARFDLTVAESRAIQTQRDPGLTSRQFQLENGHDTIMKKAGLWDAEINDFYVEMERVLKLHKDLFSWVHDNDSFVGAKVPNIQEMQNFLDKNPESLKVLQEAAAAVSSGIFEADGKTLRATALEKRMDENLERSYSVPVLDENGQPKRDSKNNIVKKKAFTGETVDRQHFFHFCRTFHQMIWDHMDGQKRERIRQKYIAAVEAGFKDKDGIGKLPGSFWKRDQNKAGAEHAIIKLFNAFQSADKTYAAFNPSTLCPMYQIGANGCYMDACYVTAMAAGALRQNLTSNAMYAGDILQLSDEVIDHFNSMGGLRINGAGDLYADLKPVMRDLFRHAAWRGLKLKAITKQEATLKMIHEMQQDSDPDVAAKAKETVVQTTVDPYWIPVENDLVPGSAVDVYQVGPLLDRFNRAKKQDVKAQAFAAIQLVYEEFGQECAIKDGVIARKYGFSSDQIRDMAKKYPDVNMIVRAVVGTKKEIAEYALYAPKVLQTWMHASIEKSMYSDVEGRWLEAGEVGNFALGNRITEREDGLHVEGVRKSTGKKVNSDTYDGLDTYLRETYNGNTVVRKSDGTFVDMPTHQAILRTLKGHQDESASALCCTFTADANECGDCTSLCHARDSMTGQSLEAVADVARERRLFEAEDNAIAGDAAFAEWYQGDLDDAGQPALWWGDSSGQALRRNPIGGDLPYYVASKVDIGPEDSYRPARPGEIARAMRGEYASANWDRSLPPGWTKERYHRTLGSMKPAKLGWSEQVDWISDQLQDLGFTVRTDNLSDGSVAYSLSGPQELLIRMGAGEYARVEMADSADSGQPLAGDFDLEFTPPGADDLSARTNWVGALRGLGRLLGQEAAEAEIELDRRELSTWRRSSSRLFQAEAYHGTYAVFEQFDHSYMGSGEGAQVYGWGTYITELAELGENYAEKISDNRYGETGKTTVNFRPGIVAPSDTIDRQLRTSLLYQSASQAYADAEFRIEKAQDTYEAAKEQVDLLIEHLKENDEKFARLKEAGKVRSQEAYDTYAEIEVINTSINSQNYLIEDTLKLIDTQKQKLEFLDSQRDENGELGDDWYTKYTPGFHIAQMDGVSQKEIDDIIEWLNYEMESDDREVYLNQGIEALKESLKVMIGKYERSLPGLHHALYDDVKKALDDTTKAYELMSRPDFDMNYDGQKRVVYDVIAWEGKDERLLWWERAVDPQILKNVQDGLNDLLEQTQEGSVAQTYLLEGLDSIKQSLSVLEEGPDYKLTGARVLTGAKLYKLLMGMPLGENFEYLNKQVLDENFDAYHLDSPVDKEASLWLLDRGIDGVTMPTNFLSNNWDEQSPRNYVVFDDKAIKIRSRRVFQVEPSIEKDNLAIATHGLTDDIREAGWVLPDGRMLDFSEKNDGGEPGQRSLDHRGLVLQNDDAESDLAGGYEAGYVRVSVIDGVGYVDAMSEPTSQQYSVIAKVLSQEDGAAIDMSDGVRSVSFDAASGKKALGMMRRFYRGEDVGQTNRLFEKDTTEALLEALKIPMAELQDVAREFDSAESFREFLADEGELVEELDDAWYEEFWQDAQDVVDEELKDVNDNQEFLGEMQDRESLLGFLARLADNLTQISRQDPLIYNAAKRAMRGDRISDKYLSTVRSKLAAEPDFWRKTRDGVMSEKPPADSELDMNRMDSRIRIARSLEDPNDRLMFWRGELTHEMAVIAHEQAQKKVEQLEGKIEAGEKVAKEELAAAKKAVAEKFRQREYMDKLSKRISRPVAKACNWRYREAIEEIQARFDPKRRSKGTLATRAMIEELQDELGEHIVGDTRRSQNQFTIEELEELANQVTALRQEGRALYVQQQQNKVERRKAMREALMDAALNGDDLVPPEFFGSEEYRKDKNRGKISRNLRAEWDRPNRIFRFLDGERESGAWQRRVWRKINELTDSELRNIDRRQESLITKMKELGIKEGDFYGKKYRYEGVTYSLNDVMFFYGAAQNPKARAAVIYGVLTKDVEKDGEAIMNGLIDQLSEEHKAFVDYTIDQFDVDWDRVRNIANELDNVNPGKEYRYLPLFRLDNFGQTLQEEVVGEIKTRMGLGMSTPKKGMINERQVIKDLRQKPIRTDFFSVVTRAIEMQEHYVHFSGFTRDMIALQKNDDFRTALRQRFGDEGVNWLKTYVDHVADPNSMREQDTMGKLAMWATQGMGVAYLAYNVSTIVKQVSALPLYAGYAGPHRLAQAAAEFAVNPVKMWKMVSDMDPQLKHRVMDQAIERIKKGGNYRDDAAAMRAIKEGRDKVNEVGFWGIQWVDMAVAGIGWRACFLDAKTKNMSDAEAAAYAQDVMLKTQSAARPKDLAQAYRTGGDFKKLFLVFSNQIHQMYQMVFRDLPAAVKQKNIRFLVASATGLAIAMAFEGAVGDREWPEDPEDVPRWLGLGVLEKIPLIGKDAASGLRGWTNSGQTPLKIVPEMALAAKKAVEAAQDGDTDELALDLWKTMDDGLAIAFRFPYSGPRKIANAIREEDIGELIGRKREDD